MDASDGAVHRERRFSWLFELPPHSERTLRMEALIARLRLVVCVINAIAFAFLIDHGGMNVTAAWWLIILGFVYGVPTVVLEPYRRWKVFRTSLVMSVLDSATIAAFIAVTGASESPFFLLYYLSVVAVAMRFELRQALVCSGWYAVLYALVYLWAWEPGRDAFGELTLRLAYMMIISIGVGHLAREEIARAQQVEEVERLNVENQKLHSKNEKAARYDKLTGILNRHNFEKDAQRELRKARGSTAYHSVLFCDMDGLKRVNDELGHDAGDRVLRLTGAAFKRTMRGSDLVGRYGGDEFVALLSGLTREIAYDRADALIESVRGVNEGLPEHLHVGLSVGIAAYPFDAQDYTTLVRLADQAMYLGKREGGNRVRTANDLRLFWEELPAAS